MAEASDRVSRIGERASAQAATRVITQQALTYFHQEPS